MVEMMSVRDTAERYGLSCYFVRSLLLAGRVHGVRIGRGKLLVNIADLERYLSECYVNEPTPDEPSNRIKPVNL